MEQHAAYSPARGGGGGMRSSTDAPQQQPALYDQTVALTFHQTDYLLHAYVRYAPTLQQQQQHTPGGASLPSSPSASQSGGGGGSGSMPVLVVEAEQRVGGLRWVGEFTAQYIEEMSLKTGNFKKFNLFVRMLSSALAKASDTVFIDLLTFADLEALKHRKHAATGAGTQPTHTAAMAQKSAMAAAQNKRYIILTYAAEFDRVHYPLPLKFEAEPNPTYLKQTVARLRSEVDILRAHNGAGAQASQATANTIEKYKNELYRLAEENHRLKAQLAANDSAKSASATAASSTLSISPHELEQLNLELRSLRSQLESKNADHADVLRQMHGLMSGMPVETLGLQTSLDNMSKQIWNLQEELRVEQQLHSKAKHKAEAEQEIMLAELERRLEAERLLRNKCRRLQDELEDMHATIAASKGSRGLRGSVSSNSIGGSRNGSMNGPPGRRPLSATTPSPQRTQNRPNSRPPSRPISAASSRSSSPAPVPIGRGRSPSPAAGARGRSPSPAGSTGGARSRSPSPSLSNGRRFDPSAYVKHKAALLVEQQNRASMAQRDGRTGRLPPQGSRSPRHDGLSSSAEFSPSRSSSRHASRSASNVSLNSTSPVTSSSQRALHSDRSRRSPAQSNSASAMPPRVPRARPASATGASSSNTRSVRARSPAPDMHLDSETDDHSDALPPPPRVRAAQRRETSDDDDEPQERSRREPPPRNPNSQTTPHPPARECIEISTKE